jgi:hypothetical protein
MTILKVIVAPLMEHPHSLRLVALTVAEELIELNLGLRIAGG